MNSNDSSSSTEDDLIQHFKDVIEEFKISGVTNVVTDYPTMFHYLLKKYKIEHFSSIKNNDSMKLYYALTHRIVPSLEKQKILKRYKMFDGRWVFMIKKEKII